MLLKGDTGSSCHQIIQHFRLSANASNASASPDIACGISLQNDMTVLKNHTEPRKTSRKAREKAETPPFNI
jgi:hypothetical protein